MLFDKSIICPYCFQRFPAGKVQWRCNSYFCKQQDKLEDDPAFFKYHQSVKLQQPHILGGRIKVKNGFAQCDKCNEVTNIRICPECHSALPDTKENIIISIVGAPGAGKSYYVGTLLRQLRTHIHTFGCSFKYTTKNDEKLYMSKFKANFDKGMKLEKTQQPTDEDNFLSANTPLLCDLRDKNGADRTFTFFDAAGENFDDVAIMDAVAKYIQHSTAILLLLDPLQIETVRNTLKTENAKADVREGETILSYDDILNNLISVIRSQKRMAKKTIIDIPLAIAFSKWDLIEHSPELCQGSTVSTGDSPHFKNGFDAANCDNVSAEIEGLLAHWGCENFLLTVQQNFSKYKFFGVSAIGAAPEANGKVPIIVSKRVEDPFLWLLDQRHIIV